MKTHAQLHVGALIVAGTALAWALLYLADDPFCLTFFQEREILRAQGLFGASPNLLGPETNLGGRLPGPFYSLLLSVPLAVGGWAATPRFLAMFLGLGIAVAAEAVRRRSGTWPALLCGFTLAGCPLLVKELTRNWNPSFGIPLTLLVATVGLGASGSRPRITWLLWGLLISAGVQVHGIFVLYYAAAAWTLFRSESKGQAVALFGVGALAPFVPVVAAGALGASAASLPRATGYLLSFFSGPPHPEAFSRAIGVLLPGSALALPLFLFGARPHPAGAAAARIAWRLAACQLPPAAIFVYGGYGPRYAIGFAATLIFSVALSRRIDSPPPGALALSALTVLLLLSLQPRNSPFFVKALASPIWSGLGLPLDPIPRIREAVEITREIATRTGWSYEEFRHQTIAVGIHHHAGWQLAYQAQTRGTAPGEAPTGLFLVHRQKTRNSGQEESLAFLEQELATSGTLWLLDEIDLRISDKFCTKSGTLCAIPYVARTPHGPTMVHNLGITYLAELVPFRALVEEKGRSGRPIYLKEHRTALFTWERCPPETGGCRNAIVVELSSWKRGDQVLTATIVGDSLSRLSRLIAPWNEAWEAPYVEAECGGRPRRYEIVPRIGNFRTLPSMGILAPVRRSFLVPCGGKPVTSLRAGMVSSMVFRGLGAKPALTLPGLELGLRLPAGNP